MVLIITTTNMLSDYQTEKLEIELKDKLNAKVHYDISLYPRILCIKISNTEQIVHV